ncbi:hypothetical protein Tco_0700975 [Tanacetum coccineum]
MSGSVVAAVVVVGGSDAGGGRRVESSDEDNLGEEDASKQGRIDVIDVDEDISLVNAADVNAEVTTAATEEVVMTELNDEDTYNFALLEICKN